MGSRIGTHTLWTVALSVAITLLALSPTVFPHGTSLLPLPGPIAGAVQIGRVVASSVGAPEKERAAAEASRESHDVRPSAADDSPPLAEAPGSNGVLTERADGTEPEPKPSSQKPDGKATPGKSLSGPKKNGGAGRDDDDHEPKDDDEPGDNDGSDDDGGKKAQKAEKKAEKAEAKAEKKEEKAEKKAEKAEKKSKDEKHEDDD